MDREVQLYRQTVRPLEAAELLFHFAQDSKATALSSRPDHGGSRRLWANG